MTPRNSFTRFAAVGLLATITHILVAVVCVEQIGFGAVLSNGVAFLFATTGSYFFNTAWSFGKSVGLHNAWRYTIVATASGLITIITASIVEHAKGHYLLGIALIVLLVPPTSYLAHRWFTYHDSTLHSP
jgi:putative flippase GtrA